MKIKILQFIMVFCAISLATAQNLIPNGDMSSWAEGSEKPDGYSYNSTDLTPEMFFSKSTEKYNKTMNVLKLTYKNNSTGSTRSIITPNTKKELEPGSYKLTFYVKGSGYLRSVNLVNSNVKILSKIKTSDVALAGDSVMVARPMGKNVVAQQLSDWTMYEVTYNVSVKGPYQICFSNNNKDRNPKKPFQLANVVLERMKLSK